MEYNILENYVHNASFPTTWKEGLQQTHDTYHKLNFYMILWKLVRAHS